MAEIPPILQQLGKSNIMQMIQPAKQIMNMVRTAQNPQAMLQQIASNNPNMAKVMEVVQQYGGDSMKAFQETAKQMGIDPNNIMNMLKG